MTDEQQRQHFHRSMFHGYDFDSTMLRIGSMNMLLHGVEQPDIRYRDSLSEGAAGEEGLYSLILANPPFAGSLDYESTSKDLQRVVKTKKTELLFLALFLRLLKPGGRAAVIVPDGVLFGSSKAHKDLRRILVEEQKLDAVVKLPSGVFKPYAAFRPPSCCSRRRTAAAPTTSGSTTSKPMARAWTTSARALPPISLDPSPEKSMAPGGLRRDEPREEQPSRCPRSLDERDGEERKRTRTEQSFCVPKADIVAQGYDLSLNRYKETVDEEVEHQPPLEIIADAGGARG